MNLKYVKNRLKDETLDLSLCDLKEVPVREIAIIKKATHLDLSNNLLTFLPNTFINLTQIIKLDLSRNMLTEIPENFGELRQLRHLDLYANQISRLPLSLSELKSLRWLDLKENPLTPAVASVAGPCSNSGECQACARNIVTYLSQVKITIEEEKLRRINAAADIASTKRTGKRKKKKPMDKGNKQDLVKNKSNSVPKVLDIDRNEIKTLTVSSDEKCTKEQHTEENICRTFLSTIMWLFLFIVVFLPTVVFLLLYSKQLELVVNYFETNIGIALEMIQQHCINIYDYLNYVYKNISINE